MRGIVLVACGLACLSFGADRLTVPGPSLPKIPGARVNERSLPADLQPKPLRDITMPIVAVPTASNPPNQEMPAYRPGPLSDDKMKQTYLSPEGVVLWANTLKEPISLSQAHVHHVVVSPDTTILGASGNQNWRHEMRYTKAQNTENILAVAVFNQVASGKREYIYSLTARHHSGPLKDQVRVQIHGTEIRPEDVVAVSDEQIAVKFTYDPADSWIGNQVVVFITYSLLAPETGVKVMDYHKTQLLLK